MALSTIRLALLSLLPLTAAPDPSTEASTPTVRFVAGNQATVVEVRGVEPARLAGLGDGSPGSVDWSEFLVVYTEAADASRHRLPPLLGTYSVEEWGIRFEPRFPLIPGQTYVARWLPGEPLRARRKTFTVPRPEVEPSTRLVAVYPSGTTMPENLLRIYLQFSAAMSREGARRHVRLLDESGAVVEAPFVAPERELWSPDRARLTLFFDPGRIKRGVGPNREAGPPLERGRTYKLVVDRAFIDASGVPLIAGYEKSFDVGEPDREQPRLGDWILEAPTRVSDPVTLRFPEALDRALLDSALVVIGPQEEVVVGHTAISPGELEWRFVPEGTWGEGVYRVRIATYLEDLAGNSIQRPFELALDGEAPEVPAYIDLPFRIGG